MLNRLFRGGRGQRQGGVQGPGRGSGGGTKPGSGPIGNCICPKCGYKKPHLVGERCTDLNCPTCGVKMVRE